MATPYGKEESQYCRSSLVMEQERLFFKSNFCSLTLAGFFGYRSEQLSVHHITPRILDGCNDLDNLILIGNPVHKYIHNLAGKENPNEVQRATIETTEMYLNLHYRKFQDLYLPDGSLFIERLEQLYISKGLVLINDNVYI